MKEFTLKSIVDFLEENGYHVRQIHERVGNWYPIPSIEVEVSRKSGPPCTLYDVACFLDASGFPITQMQEKYLGEHCVAVWVLIKKSYIASQAPVLPSQDQADRHH
jgi:hypothetical protein